MAIKMLMNEHNDNEQVGNIRKKYLLKIEDMLI
jgi:hypothetical protein